MDKKSLFSVPTGIQGGLMYTKLSKTFRTFCTWIKKMKKLSPQGSLITAFRRQQNIGEIIAPSKPEECNFHQVQLLWGGT